MKKPRLRQEIVSKQLSWLLRHGAVKEGLAIDSAGYVAVDDILENRKIKSSKVTFDEIKEIVKADSKQRYKLVACGALDDNPKHWRICAVQGHSIALVTQEYPELKEDFGKEAIHGTLMKNWEAIKSSGGLSKMGRNHIHMALDVPQNGNPTVISGMRNTSQVYIYVDVRKAIREFGITFVVSDNNVILSAGDANGNIPVECFKKVVSSKGEVLE